MTIPNSIQFPNSFDNNDNLFLVRDSMRLVLAEDYMPGDTSITIIPGTDIMALFSDTGLITLTEQCSEAEERAISFYYGSKTDTTFDQLELLDGFTDSIKPKNITNVTQNVMAEHHNNLKNALIEIQKFAGKKGQAPIKPLEGTMEQRITYLRNIALVPKAWFKVDKTVGLAPLTVTFTDQSFRLGTDGTSQTVTHLWDFGDNTGPSIIEYVEDTEVPSNITNVVVNDPDGQTIIKTYTKPGFYTVTLTVENDFGQDTVVFTDIINAKFPAPQLATINLIPRTGQSLVRTGLPSSGPYVDQTPVIRAAINTIIDIEIPNTNGTPNINPITPIGEPTRTYAGEEVDGYNIPIDPIINYTWNLSDDLSHGNSVKARAVFSVGGVYDLNLRADTTFGSYRITSYQDCFDIVERVNLWLWTYTPDQLGVRANEFGLLSETFKATQTQTYTLLVNDDFLTAPNLSQKLREFKRNVGFSQITSVSSGNNGSGIIYYASGRAVADSPAVEKIHLESFNGFLKVYTSSKFLFRPWNWVDLPSPSRVYFVLGSLPTTIIPPNTSPTNQVKDSFEYSSYLFDATPPTFTINNYKNNAQELQNNEVSYDSLGEPKQGHMSVYRSCWHESAGYFMRNQGVEQFFRMRSFYRTEGNTSNEFVNLRKLPDMPGSSRVEGQLVSLRSGVYFFTNSGAVAAYNPTTGVWGTGGPGVNSAAYRLLQDNTVIGFDDPQQTFLCASDSDQVAYLSFDYSNKAFIKFSEVDTTFSSVTSRPSGSQWNMAIF